jgi:hypothetical protein
VLSKVGLMALLGLMLAAPVQASELLDVRGTVEGLFPGPGGETSILMEWGVGNLSNEATISVILTGYIVYSNGVRQQVFPPQVLTLGPNEVQISLAGVRAPRGAAPGPATFHTEARVQRVQQAEGSLGNNCSGCFAFYIDRFVLPGP